ncbi:MAG: tRNA 2-thiouridine(34) synthase MnmA [Herminiimonas sp.]|uniref:tRNA 2-thiouridine(34) synthase MnmA n=1 Tax=Herminiimonas sp. TaxID=1926289 RepID=UPI0027235684|nr:tRNA 2-thiouridine(34) synthase MnmA [Herminiimonas sp.]MDO9422333.1 tRNA 2-thiouridine(34) synthase MnmA [Herminiimonas sp.]
MANGSAKKRVVIGMSGGVDSSVSAWLLKEQGYEVIGLFMKNWEDDDDSEYCSTRQDWIDAVSVADVVGVDIEAVNFASEYKDRVFAEFLREYQAGRTPNPDVLCNAEIKFKAFLDHAMHLGADMIATGHYARVREVASGPNVGQTQLLKAVDASKDQSYFLHRLNQAQLSKTLFPLGEIRKTEVRKIAEQLKLPNATKKDSTGICFIGERPFRDFLNRYLSYQPGPMKTPDGAIVGEHVGLSFYTLGQRKGIGLGGMKTHKNTDGNSDPWYVARKDVATNTLYIVQGHDHPWLLSSELSAGQMSWVAGTAPDMEELSAKTRYRQADVACTQHTSSDSFSLNFEIPQWAVTPGQSAVLYDGDVCLGGGIINASTPIA